MGGSSLGGKFAPPKFRKQFAETYYYYYWPGLTPGSRRVAEVERKRNAQLLDVLGERFAVVLVRAAGAGSRHKSIGTAWHHHD